MIKRRNSSSTTTRFCCNKHQFNGRLKHNELLNLKISEFNLKKKVNMKFLYWYCIHQLSFNIWFIQLSKDEPLTNEQKIQVWKLKTKLKIKIWKKIKSIEDFWNTNAGSNFTAVELKKLTLYDNIRRFRGEGGVKKKIIVDKINSHSMKNGNKQTNEKNFLKSMKLLQKKTNKQTNELIKLSIIFSTPLHKVHKIEKKKQKNKYITELPKYLGNSAARISLAIKFIISACKQKKLPTFAECFSEEILLNAQKKGVAVQKKNDLQEKVLKNEKYTKLYRWK